MLFLKQNLIKKAVYIIFGIIIILDISYLLFIHLQKRGEIQDPIYYEGQINLSRSVKFRDAYLYQENWKDSISLSDLAKNGSILVLRIPLVSCQECKFSELDNLKIFYDQSGIRNMCAIINVNSPRDLKALTLAFDLKFLKLGSVKTDILDIPEEKLNRPFYFILNPDLQANMFYFPDQDKKNTIDYFKKIKAKYFE